MRKHRAIALIAVVVIATTLTRRSQLSASESPPVAHHVMLTPAEIKWQPFPVLGPGIQSAMLSGDPNKVGSPFIFRLKMPDGTKVPPHWHPVDEHVTVISGTFLFGTGEKFDTNALRELPAGSYAFMPKRTRHFALAKGDTIIQLNGVGPFRVIYVNPADDPLRRSASPGTQSP
jgi:quercetin dioxygenase-like cupin family protein